MSEFLSGCMMGLIQNISGHPFDTIKVFKQNNKQLNPVSVLCYYRGFIYPTSFSMLGHGFMMDFNKVINSNINNEFISGSITGLVMTPGIYLFELGKLKKQIKKNINFSIILNSKGFFFTSLREFFGTGIYLGSYNKLFNDYEINAFLSGGIAGVLSWTFTYPFDTIKNRQITYNINVTKAIERGFLWKGFTVCIIRALIVNSTGFYAYELTNNYICKYK